MTAAPEETLQERIAYSAYAAVERVAMALPDSIGRPLFDVAGIAAFHLSAKARRVVSGNLSRVLGRPAGSALVQAATKEAFRNYARYWYDTFHARVLSDEEFTSRHELFGREHLAEAMEKGTGAVVALPHLGNWDTAGKMIALQGWDLTAVAELLRPERLYRLFLDHRIGLGMNVLPLAEDRQTAEECVRLIGENHIIALVSDRDLKGNGVVVEMFGEQRRMPAGPALLSLATGAPLLACSCTYTPNGWITKIEPPLEIERSGNMRDDVTELTRALAKRFERAISAAPTEWHMFQPAWDGSAIEESEAPESAGAAAGAAAP